MWSVLVTQARVYFWTYLLLYVALIVGLFFAKKYAIRWIGDLKRIERENTEKRKMDTHRYADEEEEMPYLIGVVVTCVGSGILTLTALLSLPELISMAVNPEYWALQQIFTLMKQ